MLNRCNSIHDELMTKETINGGNRPSCDVQSGTERDTRDDGSQLHFATGQQVAANCSHFFPQKEKKKKRKVKHQGPKEEEDEEEDEEEGEEEEERTRPPTAAHPFLFYLLSFITSFLLAVAFKPINYHQSPTTNNKSLISSKPTLKYLKCTETALKLL